MKCINKLFSISALLFLFTNLSVGQRIMYVNSPSSTVAIHSVSGIATKTEVPVAFDGRAEDHYVDIEDWWTVLEDHNGQKYDSRNTSLNQLQILTPPGGHTWYWRMYETNNSSPVKIVSINFTVQHSIQVLNSFDLTYGGSLLKIDNATRTSGSYAYKLIEQILNVEAINQEYNGTIYAWKDITGEESSWQRTPKDVTLYSFKSYSKNYNYSVVADDNGARLRGVLYQHSLLNAPSNFYVSAPFGQNPVLTWSTNTNIERSGYRVFKKYTTSSGTQTLNVFTTGNTHTDINFESDIKFGTDEVEYWVIAEDIYGFSSNETQHISIEGTSYYQWKIANEENNQIDIEDFALESNYPNPFNPSTQISYQLPENSFVNLVVYNVVGQKVAELVNQEQTSGKYTVKFDASNLPSGVYIYKLQAGEFSDVKKMLLTK